MENTPRTISQPDTTQTNTNSAKKKLSIFFIATTYKLKWKEEKLFALLFYETGNYSCTHLKMKKVCCNNNRNLHWLQFSYSSGTTQEPTNESFCTQTEKYKLQFH